LSRRKYTSGEFAELIGNSLPFSPNEDQKDALRKISEFLFFGKENPVFVLKGYAGTGKTNLISV
jgi:exodeoxyribonuclease-5